MNLIIDAGNTSVKLAVFDNNQLISEQQVLLDQFTADLQNLLERHPGISHCIISSVSFLDPEDVAILTDKFQVIHVCHKLKTPFKNQYTSPETLGADRIALAAAAVLHYPKQNSLIVDAGTCITYDMVTSKGAYVGGAISPGLLMRYQAMHYFTARLPELEPSDFPDFIGDTTERSMHSGVINGLCHEIEGVIGQYETRYEHLTVILTGGDAQFLSNRLKKAIFAHSNFLLEGLNFLLEFNKS